MERVWNAVTRVSIRVVRGSDGVKYRTGLDDAVVVVCLLLLVGLVVFGGLLMLFHRVAAELPLSLMLRCPEVDGCLSTGPGESDSVWLDGSHADEPEMTR